MHSDYAQIGVFLAPAALAMLLWGDVLLVWLQRG